MLRGYVIVDGTGRELEFVELTARGVRAIDVHDGTTHYVDDSTFRLAAAYYGQLDEAERLSL